MQRGAKTANAELGGTADPVSVEINADQPEPYRLRAAEIKTEQHYLFEQHDWEQHKSEEHELDERIAKESEPISVIASADPADLQPDEKHE